jgi:UDP-N-acetylmuramyl tripeptide synthase
MSLTSTSSAVAWLRERGATELVTDSRKVQLSNGGKTAFIAWPGAAVDGRAFIPEAIKNGAVAALMEADTKLDAALKAKLDMACVRAYSDLKAASGDIASEFYGLPSERLRIIAITGTNGKTSSSWWRYRPCQRPIPKSAPSLERWALAALAQLKIMASPHPILCSCKRVSKPLQIWAARPWR